MFLAFSQRKFSLFIILYSPLVPSIYFLFIFLFRPRLCLFTPSNTPEIIRVITHGVEADIKNKFHHIKSKFQSSDLENFNSCVMSADRPADSYKWGRTQLFHEKTTAEQNSSVTLTIFFNHFKGLQQNHEMLVL